MLQALVNTIMIFSLSSFVLVPLIFLSWLAGDSSYVSHERTKHDYAHNQFKK